MTFQTRIRLLTVVLTPFVAVAAWGLIRLAGIKLVTSLGSGTSTVGPVDVAVAALIAALAAWALVHGIARQANNPRRAWSLVSSTALAVSMVGPSYLADGTSAVSLMALHVVTAAVVIGGLGSTLPAGGRRVSTTTAGGTSPHAHR
jgi:hypothetical protein